MSRSDFAEFMKAFDLSPVDVAAALKIHPITVTRFCAGEKVKRSTEELLRRYMADVKRERQEPPKAASG